MSKCTWEYKGKTYSTDRLYRELVKELPSRNQQESIDFLMEYLGMPESEITIIKGLIENRSLGRFKKDGEILLSDLADTDVAYHEAFHRVWRLYLSSEERLVAINEVKKRKGIQSMIEGYREVYPKLSENELIEEILADEFGDYTMNSDYKTELPIKSFFQRLWNFLKKLVGIKPQQVQAIYDKILSKAYVGKPKSVDQYLKDADKVLIGGHEFTIEEKNEITRVLTQRFIKGLLNINGDVEALTGKSSSVKLKSFLLESIIPAITSDLAGVNEDQHGEIIDAIYEDTDSVLENPDASLEDSILLSGMVRSLRLLGLNIKDNQVDDTDGSLDDETKATREFTASVEIDPKSRMGAKVKLLLASLSDPTSRTSVFGFNKPLSYNEAFVQIGTRMLGIPTSKFREELKLLNLPYIQDLIKVLNKDFNFENEFIATMSMTENKFYKMQYKDGDIYFYDANSGTRKDSVLTRWQNNLLKNIEDWESWKEESNRLRNTITKVSNDELATHLGLDLNPQIPHVRAELQTILDKVVKYDGERPESKNLHKDLDIEGFVKHLAEKQMIYEDNTDVMVSMNGNKLYTMGLNTQQTRIINNIAYAQTSFLPQLTDAELVELSQEEAIQRAKEIDAANIRILKEFAPAQVSEFNVTLQEDGTYIVHNEWIKKILKGEKLELIIPYLTDTQQGEESEISKLNEGDLFALHLNGVLQGVTMSMKHSDRGTFFAYKFGNNPLFEKASNSVLTLQTLEDVIAKQISLERKFALKNRDQNIPVQYIGKDTEGEFYKDIIGDNWEEFLKTGKLNTSKIKSYVKEQFELYKQDIKDFGLLEEYSAPIYKKGKKEGKQTRLKGINQNLRLKYVDLDLLLADAFVNETASHIFETNFFSGNVRAFKNGNDMFKRLSPQSSTGKVPVNDIATQQKVREKLDQDFEILNPVTGEMEIVNPATNIGVGKDHLFRAVTGKERENFESHLLELATSASGKPLISKLTGKQENKLFMTFEFQFIKDFPDKTIDELKKIYLPKFELYQKKYKEANENDGISYMVLPAFKNFLSRLGLWSDGMEMVYQTEMKIASMTSMDTVADMEITVNGVTFKPFEVNPGKFVNKQGDTVDVDGWSKRVVDEKLVSLSAVHTLKTQFGGYATPEEYYDASVGEMEYMFNAVFKTSQHILLPSAILGTNLQLMNFSLLSNGIDIYHMGSANKVGGVDPKLAAQNIKNNDDDSRNSRIYLDDVAERGLDFYDKDGYFNHNALSENADILTYLSDWDDLKDQVQIGNKVKTEVKGSTQSLKNLLSNLIVNEKERFVGAQQLVDSYKDLVNEMVKTNHDNLLTRIGFDIDTGDFSSLDQLKNTILESSQMQAAPDNIRNSVENFFNDTSVGIEAVPMKNKIENVLYSLITNGIISFDRPGTSYPQTPVTGYELLGSRKFNEDGSQVSNQDTLKFYNPVFDDEGNVTEVEPAEIIMPLPDKWIKPLLRWANTNNLVKAIEKLNANVKAFPEIYQVKGLRIPNQQLSSNDIFQIKKFNLPTMQNYVIVPTEIVVKVGSDFDIDKLNIYWGNMTDRVFGITDEEILDFYDNHVQAQQEIGDSPIPFEEFYIRFKKDASKDQELLNLEKEILLNPRNVHHLLMPLTDEIFVKDIYNSLVKDGVITEPSKSSVKGMLPSTNVRNSVIFVRGKEGVGPVALAITNLATNQADQLSISKEYVNQEENIIPTKLLFQHMEDVYSLDNYTDNKGTVITEILSQLLTTQVDNVKNPTAVLMNINMQTLGILLYLIRRKINPKSIILLLNQPIIKKYLEYQRRNESLFNKQAKLFDKSNGELANSKVISKLLSDLNYSGGLPEDIYLEEFTITDSKMIKNIKDNKFDKEQLNFLGYFQELMSQSRAFSDFQATQNSDTKGLKDKQALDEADQIQVRVDKSNIIDWTDKARLDNEGVIAPFYQFGRKSYSIYDRFYNILNSNFGSQMKEFKNAAAVFQKGENKDRVRQAIENDFILFIIQRTQFSKDEFDRLMKGNSVAKRVRELKEKLPSNLVLKSFLPVLNNSIDAVDNRRVDNLRLFEKELTALDSNDLRLSLEEIYELDQELYTDIVKLIIFQTGLNISPFNYSSVIPVGLDTQRNDYNKFQYIYQDILSEAMVDIMGAVDTTQVFEEFKLLFAANNPKFLNNNTYARRGTPYPYPLIRVWDRDTKKTVLQSSDKKNKYEQAQLGNAYMKQYFSSLIGISPIKVKTEKDFLNDVFENTTEPVEYTPYEDVTNVPEKQLPSGEKVINIYAGTNENAELSNFANRPFSFQNQSFDSVEQAFQYAKIVHASSSESTFNNNIAQQILDSSSAAEIKKLGRKFKGLNSKTWDEVSTERMKKLIKASFEQNPKALKTLLATGNAKLTHTQDKGKWGKEFPRLLMEVRDELKEVIPMTSKTSTSNNYEDLLGTLRVDLGGFSIDNISKEVYDNLIHATSIPFYKDLKIWINEERKNYKPFSVVEGKEFIAKYLKTVTTEEPANREDYLSMPEVSMDPKIIENLDEFQVVFTIGDTNDNVNDDQFFPTDFASKVEAVGKQVKETPKTEAFEKEMSLRNNDGSRKKYLESEYTRALNRVKLLNGKYPSMFELIKTTGEKGDSRVYYSIRLSRYGTAVINSNLKPDLKLREKYFENSSTTDVKTILGKISKSDSNLASVAKQLLKYANVNNVSIRLVREIDEPVFDNAEVSITRGIYYNKNSKIKPNSIEIAEFSNQSAGRAEAVIIHEILHALTVEELRTNNNDVVEDFQKLFEHVQVNSPKGMYALSDLDEFMAGIFTDSRFIQHLKTVPPLTKVKEYKNLFEEIIELFKKLFNLNNTSALTQALSMASNIVSNVQTKSDFQTSFNEMPESYASKEESQYVPSLKLYEGFINMNQLYSGDEILPFIGESEYYRYLVPMLLKMNPSAKTMFTNNISDSAIQEAMAQNLPLDYLTSVSELSFKMSVRGASFNTMNTNFVRGAARTKTVIHELVHLTLQKEYENNPKFKSKIDELFTNTKGLFDMPAYGFKNAKEFLAESMSNPEFMEILNGIEYKEETLWTYLMTLVSDFLNELLNVELNGNSVLAEVIRVSEQVLNNNISEISKNKQVTLSTLGNEVLTNWDTYFPNYSWMNDSQKQMTAKLIEEGKITLNCKI